MSRKHHGVHQNTCKYNIGYVRDTKDEFALNEVSFFEFMMCVTIHLSVKNYGTLVLLHMKPNFV